MPFLKVWVHFVWTTKNREPFLNKARRSILFEHIKFNAIKHGIYIDCINGFVDHVHCLIRLNGTQTLSQLMKQIKGESARWLNQHEVMDLNEMLVWQRSYWAASVNESALNSVRKYIEQQEEHHMSKSFNEEYQELLAQ